MPKISGLGKTQTIDDDVPTYSDVAIGHHRGPDGELQVLMVAADDDGEVKCVLEIPRGELPGIHETLGMYLQKPTDDQAKKVTFAKMDESTIRIVILESLLGFLYEHDHLTAEVAREAVTAMYKEGVVP